MDQEKYLQEQKQQQELDLALKVHKMQFVMEERLARLEKAVARLVALSPLSIDEKYERLRQELLNQETLMESVENEKIIIVR